MIRFSDLRLMRPCRERGGPATEIPNLELIPQTERRRAASAIYWDNSLSEVRLTIYNIFVRRP